MENMNMSFADKLWRRQMPALAERLGYSTRDILVIVNIDDVGLHNDEVEASFQALSFGLVKSGSVMPPSPAFEKVVEVWQNNREIDLGIHLTLTCEWGNKYPWVPLLSKDEVPSLYNGEGLMWETSEELFRHAKLEDIRKEMETQVKKVIESGLKASHLDYHMNFGYHPEIFPIAMDLARMFNLSMRVDKRRVYRLPFVRNNLRSLQRKGYVFPDSRKGIYLLGRENQTIQFRKEVYYKYLRSLRPGVHCVQVHVCSRTDALRNFMGPRDLTIRNLDYRIWTSEETKLVSERLGIKFVSFRQLQELQGKCWSLGEQGAEKLG